MKKFLYIIMATVLSVICIMSLVACDEVEAKDLVESTNRVWDASDKKKASEKVVLKDVNIGGVATILNLDINIERIISKDSTVIKLNTTNFVVKVNSEAERAIQLVLESLNMHGQVTVAQLESIISKISFELISTMSSSRVFGSLKINNVVNLFSDQKSEALLLEFDKTISDSNPWIGLFSEVGNAHLINQFMPTVEGSLAAGTAYDVEFVKNDGIEITRSILDGLGDNPLMNPDYTANKILHNTFGTTDGGMIIENHVNLSNLTSTYGTSSADEDLYISKMSVTGEFNLSISRDELFILVENVTSAINSPAANKIFCILGVIIKFNENVAVGKVQIDCEYYIN